MLEQCVDHDISYEVNLGSIDTFALQVFVRIATGCEKQIRQRIGNKPIHLFRHRPVETSQTSLNVGHANQKLCSNQRASHGGVDVAYNHDEIGFVLPTYLFELHHDPRRLFRMTARTNAEMKVRNRDSK